MKDVFQECLLLLEKYDEKNNNHYRYSSIRVFSDWSGRMIDPTEHCLRTFHTPADLLEWLKKECQS